MPSPKKQQQFQQQNYVATYFSIDVECVATGNEHNARDVAQIALVDQFERCLLNVYVKPPEGKKVHSYLTPLTGLTEGVLEGAPSLAEAVAGLRQALPPGCTLVGQNIAKDVQWLGLREGEDFQGMVDLVGLFRVWNARYKNFSVFGQDHLAAVLLGMNVGPGIAHDAAGDSVKSMRLLMFHLMTQDDPEAVARAHALLLATPPAPSFAKSNPTWEDCCMGNKRTCKCGDPFFF